MTDPYAFLTLYKESEQLIASELEDFEERTGRMIPTQYRNFLLYHNGGRPTPNRFAILTPEGLIERKLEWFLGITGGTETDDDLEETLAATAPSLAMYYPFAVDTQAKLLLISVEQEGATYYYDHEIWLEPKNTLQSGKLIQIASSFESFLTHLY